MPHGWLWEKADYYEEVETDHRAKANDRELKDLKKRLRDQSTKVQFQEMRKALPRCQECYKFIET